LYVVEANNALVRNVLIHTREAFSRLLGHLFPKKEAPTDLAKLVGVFNETKDPTLAFKQAATKENAELTMALAMSHNKEANMEKVNAAHAVDKGGKTVDIKSFKRAKKFSKNMVSLIHSTSMRSTSVAPTSSSAPTSSTAPSEVF
jgi:hypothetical protein